MNDRQVETKLFTGANLVMAGFAIGASAMVGIGALERMSYDFYFLVRVSASLTAVGLAASVEYKPLLFLRIPLIGIAILYNPLIEIHLSRSIWLPINIFTIILFLASIFPAMLPKNPESHSD